MGFAPSMSDQPLTLPESPRALIVGAGSVGLSLAAWLAPRWRGLTVLARGASADVLAERGVRSRTGDGPEEAAPVRVVRQPDPATPFDLVLICVKTFHLAGIADMVREAWGPDVIVLGVQNGLENQAILSARFSRPLFGIAGWNARRTAPGEVEAERRGELVLGAADPALYPLAVSVAARMAPALPVRAVERFTDAAWSKVVINLINATTALVGLGQREIEDREALRQLVVGGINEGLAVLRAAGVREVRFQGIPPWWLLRLGEVAPTWIARRIFERNIRKVFISSMGQDLAAGAEATELETINGALLGLAEAHGVEAPMLSAITAIARERFAARPFQPMTEAALRAAVRARAGR
ncbi:MAG: ketopantoate reductase family protein [Alphaproteobacteria bacterium]|nr:ketopantoate reductase family protein [Alphaproteobacteria bacterium]